MKIGRVGMFEFVGSFCQGVEDISTWSLLLSVRKEVKSFAMGEGEVEVWEG